MKLRLDEGLPYVTASLTYRSQSITLSKVIVDTGSAGTVFAADVVAAIGLLPEAGDRLREIDGMDFLLQTHTIIDLHRLEINPARNKH